MVVVEEEEDDEEEEVVADVAEVAEEDDEEEEDEDDEDVRSTGALDVKSSATTTSSSTSMTMGSLLPPPLLFFCALLSVLLIVSSPVMSMGEFTSFFKDFTVAAAVAAIATTVVEDFKDSFPVIHERNHIVGTHDIASSSPFPRASTKGKEPGISTRVPLSLMYIMDWF